MTSLINTLAHTSPVANNPIVSDYLVPAINFLSAGVGVVVITMIIIGGIQYSLAGNNPQAVSAAKSRIMNAIIALIAYGLMYAFLNFIIPGGLVQL